MLWADDFLITPTPMSFPQTTNVCREDFFFLIFEIGSFVNFEQRTRGRTRLDIRRILIWIKHPFSLINKVLRVKLVKEFLVLDLLKRLLVKINSGATNLIIIYTNMIFGGLQNNVILVLCLYFDKYEVEVDWNLKVLHTRVWILIFCLVWYKNSYFLFPFLKLTMHTIL